MVEEKPSVGMSSILPVSSAQIDVLGGERKIGLRTMVVKSTRLSVVLFVEVLENYRGKCGRKAREHYSFEACLSSIS